MEVLGELDLGEPDFVVVPEGRNRTNMSLRSLDFESRRVYQFHTLSGTLKAFDIWGIFDLSIHIDRVERGC